MNNNYINNAPIKQKKNINILPFLIVFLVFGALVIGGYYLYKHKDEFDIKDIIPWNDDTEEKKDTSTKNNTTNTSKLIVPTISSSQANFGANKIAITGITADDKGYVITLGLTCSNRIEWCNISVFEVLIDGYYVTTTFSVQDDGYDEEATEVEFRISQSELDNLEITGFKNLTIFFYLDSPAIKDSDKNIIYGNNFTFGNEFTVDNTKKGLLNVDTKGNITIKYYKILKTSDYTYIYFDVKNADSKSEKTVMVKKLMINDRIYEMPEFEEVIHYGAEQLIYLKIPTNKIENVESITVSFFILGKDTNDENTQIYITNEFSKKF